MATDFLEARAAHVARMTQEFENTTSVCVQPAAHRRLPAFFGGDADDLVGATWMGLYLAKRITRLVQLLAHAAAKSARVTSTSVWSAERRRAWCADRGVQQHGERAGHEPPEGGADRSRSSNGAVRRNNPERITTGDFTNASGIVTTISAGCSVPGVRALCRSAGNTAFNRSDLEARWRHSSPETRTRAGRSRARVVIARKGTSRT